MKTMTLRNIPEELADKIASNAKAQGHSLNATVVNLLSKALGLTPESRKKRDLTNFSGTWSEEDLQCFNSATAEFSKIDNEVWQ